jgi:hypothetical protein
MIDESTLVIRPMPTEKIKPHYVGFFNRFDDGHHVLQYKRVHLVKFVGDYLTAEDQPSAVMRVTYLTPDMPRGVDGTCAYCLGDPCAEDSPPDSSIARNYATMKNASWTGGDQWFTCPACQGRPT